MSGGYNFVSLIWGIGWLVILFIPYIFYFKLFFTKEEQENRKSIFEKILGIVFLQFIFAIIFLVFAEVIIYAFKVKMFNPCAGLRFFLFGIDNNNCDIQVSVYNIKMWNAWTEILNSISENTHNPYLKVSKSLLIAIATISSLFYILLIFIAFMMFIVPFIFFSKLLYKSKINNERLSVFEIIFKTFFLFFIMYLLVYFHFYIASKVAIAITNVTGFDAFKWLNAALRDALGINK